MNSIYQRLLFFDKSFALFDSLSLLFINSIKLALKGSLDLLKLIFVLIFRLPARVQEWGEIRAVQATENTLLIHITSVFLLDYLMVVSEKRIIDHIKRPLVIFLSLVF